MVNVLALLALALQAGCASPSASWDPAASSIDRTASDCERNGGRWHATLAVCEVQDPF